MTETPKIVLEGVTKSFGDNHVLKGINLEIGNGESVVLIGGSSSGKTLILKCILGLVVPDAGSIRVDGQETTGLTEAERKDLFKRTGMLFQQSALFDGQKVWENVAFRLLQEKGRARSESKELALDKLASVGMREDVGELLPSEISGGMQKRVGFARAIANDPEIVLLDEPTAGLDPIMTNVVNELILDGVRTLGATALSITSDMGGARKIGDRVAMIYDGRIIWAGTPDEVEQSGNDYVDQFIHKRAGGPDPNGGDRLNCPDVICLQKTNCGCACERPSDARQRYSG